MQETCDVWKLEKGVQRKIIFWGNMGGLVR